MYNEDVNLAQQEATVGEIIPHCDQEITRNQSHGHECFKRSFKESFTEALTGYGKSCILLK